MNKSRQPLVSVRVLTYNSSEYIVETLNSVYNQSYNNIELVVSDDCSKDNTVGICQEWIDNHKSRFVRVVYLTSPVNTGVCANSKRSMDATTGEWIKGIGGDDLLTHNAIEQFVSFCEEKKCDICASRMGYIDENGNDLEIKHGVTHENYMEYIKLPPPGSYVSASRK